ncbi:high-potential iron-sulfur protein [Salinigranum sp.]|uniref:high-potential iron-sulfur protein n=1 Tax=Salinigranum sp. TaxID=1966351 RepID=UPI00356B5DBB
MGGVDRRKRRFVTLLGALGVGALAGCTGGTGGGSTETETATAASAADGTSGGGGDHDEERPPGVSMEEFVHGPVPEVYRTALSQAGERRDPENLRTKEAVRFAEADESEFAGPNQDCGNCAEYIPDQNGDGFGACAKVEGYVDTADWCAIWESIEAHEAEGDEGGE